ncbi:MAG: biotin synthase BioB [Planctomycetes bacterium]|nr:biotin synthase BioB [Planctomycetota bacterium]
MKIKEQEYILEGADKEFLLSAPLLEVVSLANKVRAESVGNEFELCNIINAKSGSCSEDCKFCAQSSRHKTDTPTYGLKSKAEIIAAAREAKAIGAKKFGIVTSGNGLDESELDTIVEAISEITNDVGIAVCGSLGALEKEPLVRLKNAGLVRYHHNIETSANFYPEIVTTHSFDERVKTITAAKEAGLEVCSGGIIGMGESWQDRIDMALLLKELDVDSVPINLLMPIAGTAMADMEVISCEDAVRTICIFRVILRDKTIKIAAGREAILKDFQALGFMAGANGMLIGGYLTVKGRSIDEDKQLVKEVEKLWAK